MILIKGLQKYAMVLTTKQVRISDETKKIKNIFNMP